MSVNIKNIQETQKILLKNQSLDFKRYLYNEIDFSQQLIGIIGPRGVGKTTLILQYLKENFYKKNIDNAVYFLADNVLFEKGDLFALVQELHIEKGVELICIDEIHKFPNWNQELKNIYDSFPNLKIIFSGSSSIDLIKGRYDLSRRGVVYNLPGFSFREFLIFYKNINLKKIKFKSLLKNHQSLSKKFSPEDKILKYFKEYLKTGYYPFFNKTKNILLYNDQIGNTLDKIIYEDIASVYKLKTNNLITFKQILYFFATITPGEININKLASSLKRNHATIAEYLNILQEAGLVRFLTNDRAGHMLVRHAEKIYLDNTNLLYAICRFVGKNVEIGVTREIFFLNQLQAIGKIPCYTKNGDFSVDKIIFEIGGKNKTDEQIRGVKNSFLALDDILYGDSKNIPLYLFGFLY
jgi:predicted AAA+ superfamily ATPase